PAAADPTRRGRRFGAVRHVADLYDRYGVHRPEMLRAWAAGGHDDGAGGTLPAEARWQAELWRRLRERIGHPSPAERLVGACDRLRADPDLVGLPGRLALFGLTRLPVSYLDVLRALGARRHVLLFLLHPSPVLWDRIQAETSGGAPIRSRGQDPTAQTPRNPILASWGTDAREMQLVMAAGDEVVEVVDHHHPLEVEGGGPATLLARLQADIRADRNPPGLPLPGQDDARALLDPGDRSLVVHSCHGRARQVEVLRDTVLHLLAADPTLEARDVIVMCPDVEAFAPLIHATFGAAEAGDGDADAGGSEADGRARLPDLRVRLADRSLRQTNPVLGVVAELLELAAARVSGPQVLDFAAREPVRRRFRLDDSDLARCEEWVSASGVRWGLDAAHRARFALERVGANTWRSGIDRILVGVAMADEDQRLVGGVLPLDDVESGAIDLAGRFAELVDRLGAALADLSGPQPIAAWAAALAGAADSLTATAPADAWQGAQLRRLLDELVAEASTADASHPGPLELTEVAALLADRLRGRPTRANFRTGHLTICTLVPMRSVPHRVVCLLGLDDATFPRRSTVDGDDLVVRHPCVGDRDARTEDRQLLLDAVLAATDHLVVTYAGRDERTNAERPPAVPVGELLDVVDRTVRVDSPRPDSPPLRARDQVVLRHPLQPFDPRNFTTGDDALAPPGAWSFDVVALDGARALTAPRRPTTRFLAAPLGPAPADVLELDDLVAFVSHPVKAFLRQRLGFTLTDDPDELSDALPVDLSALEEWGVGQRILDARLAGASPEACVDAEVARGGLPPGVLAHPVLDEVGSVVEEVLTEALALTGTADSVPGSVEVNLRLADGRVLVGTVAGILGDVIRTVTYSRVGPRQRLAAWVRFLALSGAHPERATAAATVGRCRDSRNRRRRVSIARLAPLGDDREQRRALAHDRLGVLVDLYDRGMCEPLPLYVRTSAAYAQALRSGHDARSAATGTWESAKFANEDKDLEHRLVLGGVTSFADLLSETPRPGEDGAGWAGDEPSRFGRYARRLWDPILAHEQMEDR
ncbi:MAG: exodeoxyribonuclease V subunit gamma, partial [Acidimicrobiia bacterium]